MISLTYSQLPTREQFDAAFDAECPDGYRVTLGRFDSDACEGFMLGDGTWSVDQLWQAIGEIANADSIDMSAHQSARMDLVSAILETLKIEWV